MRLTACITRRRFGWSCSAFSLYLLLLLRLLLVVVGVDFEVEAVTRRRSGGDGAEREKGPEAEIFAEPRVPNRHGPAGSVRAPAQFCRSAFCLLHPLSKTSPRVRFRPSAPRSKPPPLPSSRHSTAGSAWRCAACASLVMTCVFSPCCRPWSVGNPVHVPLSSHEEQLAFHADCGVCGVDGRAMPLVGWRPVFTPHISPAIASP